jgi:hypothetical protein
VADPDSPASHVLRDLFPNKDAITSDRCSQVQALHPVVTGLTRDDRTKVGSAIEWRISLSLADTVPYADVFELIPETKRHEYAYPSCQTSVTAT